MKIDDAFPSKYLAAGDIPADGDLIVTIKSVTMEVLGQGEKAENKPIIYFSDAPKGLACNKTNANTIKGLYGSDTDAWIGKKLALFAAEVDFQGRQVLAIRVRMRPPAGSPMSLEQALAELDKAGVDRQTFKDALKEANGVATYKPDRDSGLVARLVAQNTPQAEAAELPF